MLCQGAAMIESSGLPLRPMLRPGVRVVRNDDHHLRIGLGPGALVLPDRPEVRSLLAAMIDGRDQVSWDEAVLPHGIRLAEAGLLVDGADFWSAVRRWRARGVTDAVVADEFTHGPGATHRLESRTVDAVALSVPTPWRPALTKLLGDAGMRVTQPHSRRPPLARLIGSLGEIRRESLDPMIRTGAPHLLLTVVEGRVTVGPFVLAGRTACLRCVDAHLADADPRRPLVSEQYADPVTDRLVPEPVDPLLLSLGQAMAVRDLATFAGGEEPATWSRAIEVDRSLRMPIRRFGRHPHCGCGWDELLDVG